MTAYVSLFRGINVGGRNKIRMDELKALHEALGLRDVLPYIQSGNVVFKSEDADPVQLRQQIEESIEKRFGFHVNVFIRTSAELAAIIEKNPFQGQSDKEAKWILVLFLADCPDEADQENLLKSYTGPEEIVINGKEAYVYYTNGIGRSKLTLPLIEKKLKTLGTGRNLNTVLQLLELTRR
jgi:uncharacterized protein (DUF1697 family)